MDRQKYINSQDYREGWDDGFKAGRKQMKKQIEYAISGIKKILSAFQDAESEDKNNDT